MLATVWCQARPAGETVKKRPWKMGLCMECEIPVDVDLLLRSPLPALTAIPALISADAQLGSDAAVLPMLLFFSCT
jgi:hypothetical protein